MNDMNEKMRSDIEENLLVGVLDLMILKLLSKEDMYGYQIKQEILTRTKEVIRIKEGTLYGPLYRMEKKGMVSVSRKLVGARRFRMYYHLEDYGAKYLDEALKCFEEINAGANNLIQSLK